MNTNTADRDPAMPQLRSPSVDRPTRKELDQALRIQDLETQVAFLKAQLSGCKETLSAACDVLEAAGLDSPRTVAAEYGNPDPCK